MTHLAIVAWDQAGRVIKYQDYDSQAGAEAHVARVAERWPGAFVAAHPGGGFMDWRVVDGALVLDPPPVPAPQEPAPDPLAELLIEKGVITRQELEPGD